MTFDDSGWFWLTLADSGLWRTARVSQSLPESSKVIQRQSESARVSQILPESAGVLDRFWDLADFLGPLGVPKKLVFGKTGAKLLLWPPNGQMKQMFIIMVTFQNRSQKWLKLNQIMTSFWHNMYPGCCNPYTLPDAASSLWTSGWIVNTDILFSRIHPFFRSDKAAVTFEPVVWLEKPSI